MDTYDLFCFLYPGGYCGPAGSIDNGYVVSSTGVQGGQTTTYACNDGFTMTSSAQIKCQANNDWWTKPTCTCKYSTEHK